MLNKVVDFLLGRRLVEYDFMVSRATATVFIYAYVYPVRTICNPMPDFELLVFYGDTKNEVEYKFLQFLNDHVYARRCNCCCGDDRNYGSVRVVELT